MKEDSDAVDLDHNLILTGNISEATMTPTETIPAHVTGTVNAITGVLPNTHTSMPILIIPAKTPHIEDHPHTEALQLTLETAVDHDPTQHTNQPGRPHTKIHHNPGPPMVIHTLKRNFTVTIVDPQMDFYSSDDHSSDAEEDSDHLN